MQLFVSFETLVLDSCQQFAFCFALLFNLFMFEVFIAKLFRQFSILYVPILKKNSPFILFSLSGYIFLFCFNLCKQSDLFLVLKEHDHMEEKHEFVNKRYVLQLPLLKLEMPC
jgi:hypothetical protein